MNSNFLDGFKPLTSCKDSILRRLVIFATTKGNSDIIKNDITVTFGRGEDNKAAQYAVLARGQGFEPVQKVGVHSQTLKAVVRERIESGRDMPSDLFKTFAGNQTKITRRN